MSERYWWAHVVGALVFIVIALALVYADLADMFGHGVSVVDVEQIFVCVVTAVFALAYAAYSLGGRKRWQLRRQAIDGDQLVIPESRIVPEVSEVFDVSRETLVLPWRPGTPNGKVANTVVLYAGGSAILVMLLAPLAQHIWSLPGNSLLTLLIDDLEHQPYVVMVLWIPVYVFVVRFLRNRLTILEATDEGTRFQPLVGRVFVMHWQGMRLLEVQEQKRTQGDSKSVTRSYALYDRRRVISWIEWGTVLDLVQPEGITWDEMWALSRELVDVIYQRTGLVPRTFSASLQRGPADAPEQSGREAEEA